MDTFHLIFGFLELRDKLSCLTICRDWYKYIGEWDQWDDEDVKQSVIHGLHYFAQHANINSIITHDCILRNAVVFRRTKMLRSLLQNPNIDPTRSNYSCLIAACKIPHNLKIIQILLLDPRVDITKCGVQALFTAANHYYEDTVKLLLMYNFDVFAKRDCCICQCCTGDVEAVNMVLREYDRYPILRGSHYPAFILPIVLDRLIASGKYDLNAIFSCAVKSGKLGVISSLLDKVVITEDHLKSARTEEVLQLLLSRYPISKTIVFAINYDMTSIIFSRIFQCICNA